MNGPGAYQLNLSIDGADSFIPSQPFFAVLVPKMRLNNNGAYIADYIKTADTVT